MSREELPNAGLDENARKKRKPQDESSKIKGTVVLMKKNFGNLTDLTASITDRIDELCGHKVSLQLISAVNCESGTIFSSK